MADQEQITVSIRSTKSGWDHVIKLIQRDSDPAWSQFNVSFIKIIEDIVKRSTGTPVSTPPSQAKSDYEKDDSPESYIGDDGQYHDEDYYNENYGSHSNYMSLSDAASDMGFPDAESYQNWLDD